DILGAYLVLPGEKESDSYSQQRLSPRPLLPVEPHACAGAPAAPPPASRARRPALRPPPELEPGHRRWSADELEVGRGLRAARFRRPHLRDGPVGVQAGAC